MALLDQSGLRTLRRLHTHYSCFGHAVSIRTECGSIPQKPVTDSTQTFCLFDLGRPGHGRLGQVVTAQCCCFSELEHLACHLQQCHTVAALLKRRRGLDITLTQLYVQLQEPESEVCALDVPKDYLHQTKKK